MRRKRTMTTERGERERRKNDERENVIGKYWRRTTRRVIDLRVNVIKYTYNTSVSFPVNVISRLHLKSCLHLAVPSFCSTKHVFTDDTRCVRVWEFTSRSLSFGIVIEFYEGGKSGRVIQLKSNQSPRGDPSLTGKREHADREEFHEEVLVLQTSFHVKFALSVRTLSRRVAHLIAYLGTIVTRS